jgi:mono/diheme cytochrome c family protein
MAIRARSILLGVLLVLIVLAVAGLSMVGWEVVLGPKARATSAAPFERTEARLARGQYLAEGPAHCFMCHTDHDLSDRTFPIVEAKKGAGWVMPIPELNNIPAGNITQDRETGIGAWTDDEIARAIREGVSRDGSALFPVMPYLAFAALDDEDVKSIVVYLRTIPPVRNAVPKRQLPGPLEYIVNTMPAPITAPQPSHPASTPAERGRYLASIATCGECHTATRDGVPMPGLSYGGGGRFDDIPPGPKPIFSLNITPDASGIAHYDEALFKEVLRTGQLKGRMLFHAMPFLYFRNMTDEDLSDIFAYVRTLTPVKHRISNTDPPALCAVCGQSHGLGELNAKGNQ